MGNKAPRGTSRGRMAYVLAMRVLPKVAGGANDNVDAVDAGLDSHPGVIHVAADICAGR